MLFDTIEKIPAAVSLISSFIIFLVDSPSLARVFYIDMIFNILHRIELIFTNLYTQAFTFFWNVIIFPTASTPGLKIKFIIKN